MRQHDALVRGVVRRAVHARRDRIRARRRRGLRRTHVADAAARRLRRRDVGGSEPQACPADRPDRVGSGIGDGRRACRVRHRTSLACRRRRIGRRHRLVHRDVHPPTHGRRVCRGRAGAARAGARHGDQFHHQTDRSDRRRRRLPDDRTCRRLHRIGVRIPRGGVPGRRAAHTSRPAAGSCSPTCRTISPKPSPSRAAI